MKNRDAKTRCAARKRRIARSKRAIKRAEATARNRGRRQKVAQDAILRDKLLAEIREGKRPDIDPEVARRVGITYPKGGE